MYICQPISNISENELKEFKETIDKSAVTPGYFNSFTFNMYEITRHKFNNELNALSTFCKKTLSRHL